MKFVLSVLLVIVLSFLAGLFLPWWSIAIVSFLVALFIPQRLGYAFLSGLTGVFIFWAAQEFWIDIKNKSILSSKIAELFHLGSSSVLLILVSAFIGALVGGFAAMSGSSLRPIRKRRRFNY